MMSSPTPRWLTIAVVACIATFTVVLQLVQTRILSFMFWSHVVYLLVYVALLGYGVAGAVAAVLPERMIRDPRCALYCLVAFALSNVASFAAVMAFAGFSPSAFLLGNGDGNLAGLVSSYALFSLPYFFLGLGLVSVFTIHREEFSALYMYDLIAAAIGCVLFVLLLEPLGAPRLVCVLSCLGLCLAWLGLSAARALSVVGQAALLTLAAAAAWLVTQPSQLGDPQPSPNKILAASLQADGSDVEFAHTAWNPVGRLDIYRSRTGKPLHLGFGISGPDSHILTYDGDSFTGFRTSSTTFPSAQDIEHFAAKRDERWMEATPYLWHAAARTLVIGVGGGADLRVAQLNGAREITGVELNRSTIRAMSELLADRNGNIYNLPNTTIHPGDGRSYLMNTDREWDVIHMTGIDTFLASTNGSFVTAENYLYTVEAVKAYWSHLSPRGVYTCVRWFYPAYPRESIRVFSNVLRALHELGVAKPEEHVLVTTFGAGQALLLLQRSAFTSEQVLAVKQRAAQAAQMIVYAATEQPTTAAGLIFDGLARAYAAREEAAFFAQYPYDVSPVYDDRPYFYQYYKPSRLWSGFWQGQQLEGAPQHGYWPYVVLGMVAAQSLALVLLFIFVPLTKWKRTGLQVPAAARHVTYFASLGLGYMMVELALMQKLALLLGDPIYSIMIVLGAMLTFTGLGSQLSARWSRPREALRVLLAILSCVLFILTVGLDSVVHAALGQPFWARALLATGVCAAVGLCLGQFFPIGLRQLDQGAQRFIPWAWGINGGFSVLGSIVTIILAMATGFSSVLGLSALVYALGIAVIAYSPITTAPRAVDGAVGTPHWVRHE